MPHPTIEPITDSSLPEFATFLNAHLASERSPEVWVKCLRASWSPSRPNYGFVLRDSGQVMGGIGAYYADRLIRGRPERFCNITSWCVLDAYRRHSMRLAMAIVGQPGYHFTDFSPTTVVGGVLRFLKFRPLDERQAVILNLPWPSFNGQLLHRPGDIASALRGEALRIYRDHTDFAWLRHVLIGTRDGWCHVIYKRGRFKGLPSARVLYLSDRVIFEQYLRGLSSFFLRFGLVTTHVECRFLTRAPRGSVIRSGFNHKLFLSSILTDTDIDYLYSESMALDL